MPSVVCFLFFGFCFFFPSLLDHRVEQKTPVPADIPKDSGTTICFSPSLLASEVYLQWCGTVAVGRSKDGLVVKSLGKGSGFRSQPCYRLCVILSPQVQAVPSPSLQSSQLWVCMLGMQTVLKLILLGEKQKVQSNVSINSVMYCIRKLNNQPLCWKHLCISSLITNSSSLPEDQVPYRESFLSDVIYFMG